METIRIGIEFNGNHTNRNRIAVAENLMVRRRLRIVLRIFAKSLSKQEQEHNSGRACPNIAGSTASVRPSQQIHQQEFGKQAVPGFAVPGFGYSCWAILGAEATSSSHPSRKPN